ncbi:MAG: hypothetical protein SOI44_03725 [Lactimicrobium sp.]|jgi:tetratricopeptide (TPR) repeat protein|uniref:hypothetical protein n=1 Tax=Lactimicrobium sp. TaxID=2563780 RepID=UPI002F352B3A
MRDDYSPQIRTYVDILLNMRKEKDDTVNTAADVLLKTGKTMQDDYLQGLALYARCFVYYRSGHAMQAYDLLRSALSHLLKTQTWPQIIGILNMIGLVSMRMGNTASAMEAYLQGLAFAEEHNLSEQITLMNINLADVCLRADAYGNAYAYVQKAESLLDQLRLNERYEEYATIAIAECALLASFTKQEEDAGRYISLVQELIKEYPSAASNPTMMILELYRTKKPADSYDCAKKLLPVMKRNDILDEGGTEFLFYLRYLSQHNYKDLFYQISSYFIHALGPDSLPGDVIPPLQVIVAFDEDTGNHERFLNDLQLLWKYTRLSNASNRESTIQYIETRSVLMDTVRKNHELKTSDRK